MVKVLDHEIVMSSNFGHANTHTFGLIPWGKRHEIPYSVIYGLNSDTTVLLLGWI